MVTNLIAKMTTILRELSQRLDQIEELDYRLRRSCLTEQRDRSLCSQKLEYRQFLVLTEEILTLMALLNGLGEKQIVQELTERWQKILEFWLLIFDDG